jgi:hypothetical protein
MLRRAVLTFALLLWCGGLWFLSVPLRQDISHTYHHWLGELIGGNAHGTLPSLTLRVSMPILGNDRGLETGQSPLFYVFWSLMWLGPLLLGAAVWAIRSPGRLLEAWVYSASIYAMMVITAAIVVIAGLWLPFSLL